LLSIRVVLADLQGHHGWKALAILKMAGSLFSSVLVSITPAFGCRLAAKIKIVLNRHYRERDHAHG
jgi:hypothetical protein